MIFKNVEEQLQIISKGTVTLTPLDELKKKLEKNVPLKIKLGADPTAPDLHLGHAVVLNKLRDLQNLGHEVIFLIGDFTARIGDPTGKSKTRPPLTEEQIQKNTETYLQQVFKILDKNRTKIVFNSSLLAHLTMTDVIKLCAKITLARVIEREDFQNRMNNQTSIGFHELLYPFLQGYDSVALEADLEIGGTDQTFNLMFGRHLQEQFGQSPQIVLTMPILEGLDGKNKMSKSLGNYVGLTDNPENAFGKIMSMPDSNLINYNKLLLGKNSNEIEQLQTELENGNLHPMTAKKSLAFGIIEKFWSTQDAQKGQYSFEEIFQKQNYENVQAVTVTTDPSNLIWIAKLLQQTGIAKTSSNAKILIESGAVVLNEQAILDFKKEVTILGGEILKVGKKIIRLQK